MMTTTVRRLSVVVAIAAAAVLAGCSAQPGAPSGTATSTGKQLSGELTVYAAASLTASFDDLARQFAKAHPGVDVKPVDYDGSSTLATQIIGGAPADVFASADQANMAKVSQASLTASSPEVFASNTLQIAVAPGNPKHITALSALGAPALKVVLCAPAVPCGAASHKLLASDGVAVKPVSEEQNVTAVVTKVASGDADAGLVYVTDVKAAAGKVDGVTIPDAGKAVNRYVIAALKNAPNSAVAKAFVAFVRSPAGQAVLARYGFARP
jgi:molybdenum ABC transporter, periplasmic molybdate-binding protein